MAEKNKEEKKVKGEKTEKKKKKEESNKNKKEEKKIEEAKEETEKPPSAFSEKAGKNFDQPFGKRLGQVAKTEEKKKIEEAEERKEKKEKSNEERKEGMKEEKKKTEIIEEEKKKSELKKELKEETKGKEKSKLEEEIQTESAEKVTKEEKKVKKKSFPWILALLAIILIVVAGFAIQKVLENQEVKQGEWDAETTKTPVEIKNFYSSECSFCTKENSVIANFNARDIKMEVKLIDLSKEENKHYINEFDLKSVPTALVNAKDLENYPLVENLIKESFTEKKGHYVIPESYLDGGKHNIMLLDALNCDSGTGKVFVEQFCDYQTLGCALIFEPTKKAREKFAGEIVFEYKNYLLHGEKSEITAIVAECAREQGRFFGFNKYLYEKQFPEAFDLNRDAVDNSLPEVINARTFVTQMPDLNVFNKCIEEKEPMQKIKDDNSLVSAYGVYFTPSLVFDCKYVVQGNENASKIEEIICVLHPELEGCKEN